MKLAIITGGSRGLGQALTEHFTEQADWQVVELSRSGSHEHHLHCDLSDPAMIQTLVEEQFSALAAQSWDEVLLISNAAMLLPISRVEQLTAEQIHDHIVTNQISVFTLISGFMKAFRDNPIPKTIINVSSGAAGKGYAGWSLYCASKAACENFIAALIAGETEQSWPFTAVNYDPGVMDTRMQADIRASSKTQFPDLERFQAFKQDDVLRAPEVVARDLVNKITLGLKSGNRYSVS
ncbi:MAG: SDR family NAD(P)-dependent oxidoreductase [Amphritea sp.]|nr:SDR family NAD(P)-dependent oxidoreductase [Amphritea sp.]